MINLNIICFVIYIYIYSCLIISFFLPFVYIFLLLLCFFFSAAAYKFSNTTTNSKQQSYEYIIIIFCTVTKLIIRFLFYLTYPGESVSILLTSSVLFCFLATTDNATKSSTHCKQLLYIYIALHKDKSYD